MTDCNSFKQCPACKKEWQDLDDFLSDDNLNVLGYQVNFLKPEKGLFLFNHLSCRSTLALRVESIIHLYEGPVYEEAMTGKDTCPGHCANQSNIKACPNECGFAHIRQLLQIIRNWGKQELSECEGEIA